MSKEKHIWQFSRIGGMNRVNLETGSDLRHLGELDQKLWTALSCPVSGLEIDPKTLALIDTDNDGKIRVPEILAAVNWITSVVKDANSLVHRNSSMSLNEINTETPLGKVLYASSKQLLANIGKPDANELTVEETSDTVTIFQNTIFNGDGVVIVESTEDESLKALIAQIIQCEGAVADRSGKDGINQASIDAFYAHCEAYSGWHQQAIDQKDTILPYSDKTEAAHAAWLVVRPKIEDYFLRCQLADFDTLSAEMLNSITSRIEAITTKELPSCIDEISGFPLSKIEARKPLLLVEGINPAWKARIQTFSELISTNEPNPKTQLTETEWKAIAERFTAYETWKAAKTGTEVEPLGIETIQTILVENKKDDLMELIAADLKLEEEANNIIQVEKMVRYHRDLFTLLNNFVTFSDFYRQGKKAIFQAGSLYFDQRRCDLCIKVSDMPKHNTMAATSGICLVYCDCVSKTRNQTMTIVAAFTDGDVDNLVVGRNAIFYDNAGNDWDAKIVKIIDNPISIRQAFWTPYRKFSQFVSKQIEKMASARENAIHSNATTNFEKSATSIAAAPAAGSEANATAKPAPFDIAKFAGIFAAISIAIGAIGVFVTKAAEGFFKLQFWQMPLAVLGIILLISGPSMILAWLKLRKRNLAPVLDANGWAVNARATINIAFGTTLTSLARLPKNSKQNLIDPYRKKNHPWLTTFIILVILVVAAYILLRTGTLENWGIVKGTAPVPTTIK